jgi:YbbR domain-containing protein
MNSLRATSLQIALAVGLSFALWAFVSLSVNPEERVPFNDLNIEVRGKDPNLVIVDQNGLPKATLPTVDVVIETDRATRGELRQVDIQPYVDLSDVSAGDRVVPVNVDRTRPGISFSVAPEGLSPEAVPIRLETLVTRTVPISISIQGNVPFSFALGEPEVRSNNQIIAQAEISGPQSRVERVAVALAVANVDQLSANYVSLQQLQAISAEQKPVEGVTVTPANVTVRIPITPIVGLKLVPVLPQIVGNPATGFVVTNIRSDPQLINITGSSNVLESIRQVSTAPIDISGLNRDAMITATLQLPPGTAAQQGESSSATVIIEIAPLAFPVQVQLPVAVQVVGAPTILTVGVDPSILQVTLSGTPEALAQIEDGTLTAIVDATGLSAGIHLRTPQLTLPPGVNPVAEIPAVTLFLRLPPTPTPLPDPTPPPEVATPTAGADLPPEVATPTAGADLPPAEPPPAEPPPTETVEAVPAATATGTP